MNEEQKKAALAEALKKRQGQAQSNEKQQNLANFVADQKKKRNHKEKREKLKTVII